MDTINDGGPAFPHMREWIDANTSRQLTDGGMSLRAYFAAHAPKVPGWFQPGLNSADAVRGRYFKWRLYYADQMLAALQNTA